MRGVLIVGVIAAGMMFRPAYGQSAADQASFSNMTLGGIHLYGVSVFSGYSTSAYPAALGRLPVGVGQLGGDTNFGGTATLGWQHHRERWNFSMMYSGTYGGLVRYSDANAFSQALSLSASRKLSTKWTLSLSGTGSDRHDGRSFCYQPSTLAGYFARRRRPWMTWRQRFRTANSAAARPPRHWWEPPLWSLQHAVCCWATGSLVIRARRL